MPVGIFTRANCSIRTIVHTGTSSLWSVDRTATVYDVMLALLTPGFMSEVNKYLIQIQVVNLTFEQDFS